MDSALTFSLFSSFPPLQEPHDVSFSLSLLFSLCSCAYLPVLRNRWTRATLTLANKPSLKEPRSQTREGREWRTRTRRVLLCIVLYLLFRCRRGGGSR